MESVISRMETVMLWMKRTFKSVANLSVRPQPRRDIVPQSSASSIGEMRPSLQGLRHALVVNEEGVADDYSFRVIRVELYENGFLVRGTLILDVERMPIPPGRSSPVSEHPEPLFAVTDDCGGTYRSWLHSAGGIGRVWSITTHCTPQLAAEARELRLVIPALLWERIDYKRGVRTIVGRQEGASSFVIDLARWGNR